MKMHIGTLEEHEYYVFSKVVVDNFDKFSNNIQVSLFKYRDVIVFIAKIISSDFDKIPEDVRNQLLLKISDSYLGSEEAKADIAVTISSNFDKIPEDVRNQLLLNLAGD